MRKSTKALLWIMIILLALLCGVIVWLILNDSKIISEEQLGNTVIGELAAQNQTAEQQEVTEAPSVPEPTQPETQTEQEIPNEKPVALYTGGNGEMERITGSFDSEWSVYQDIATFEAINSEEEIINYGDYYTLHADYWNAEQTQAEYKIGYELRFEADGNQKVITIREPADISENPDLYMGGYPLDEEDNLITDGITGYLGAWVYCDIDQEGFYEHLTQEQMTPETLLTSIKLRPTPLSEEISNLKLKAFTWSSDKEFDAAGHYTGAYGYEIAINNIG